MMKWVLTLLILVAGTYACEANAKSRIVYDGRGVEMTCEEIEHAITVAHTAGMATLMALPDGCMPGEAGCIAETILVNKVQDLVRVLEAMKKDQCSEA